MLLGMIAPCREDQSGDLAVAVSHNFVEEGQLPFGNLETQKRYVVELCTNGFFPDVFVNYLLFFNS